MHFFIYAILLENKAYSNDDEVYFGRALNSKLVSFPQKR